MARARNIKPGFFQNDELGELPPLARLLFIGMWTIADYKGCLEYRPKRIKAQILPYDDCDIEKLTINLDKSGFLSIYSVASQPYIKIINFERHQNPHKNEREAGSEIPDIDKKDSEISELTQDGNTPDKNGTAPADSLLLIPDSLLLNPSPAKAPAAPDIDSEEFEMAWQSYPRRPGASKADSLKAWKARIKAGASASEMLAGVDRYAAFVRANATEPQFIKQPQTFFGPGEHYKADWTVSPRASPARYESDKDRSRRETYEALTGRKAHDQRHDIIDI